MRGRGGVSVRKIEGKTPKTIESCANSLEDFRRMGRPAWAAEAERGSVTPVSQ
jgi:hypothetical protein